MNIEEAKKIIDKNIYYSTGERMDYIDISNSYDGESMNPCKDFIQAIETILSEYEKQINTRQIEEKYMEDNYISKDKIREQIKQIEDNPQYNWVGDEWQDSHVVALLEELLEE